MVNIFANRNGLATRATVCELYAIQCFVTMERLGQGHPRSKVMAAIYVKCLMTNIFANKNMQWATGHRLRVERYSMLRDLEMTRSRLPKVKHYCIF